MHRTPRRRDSACGDDAELRTEVERLLRACETPGHFLQEPAVEFVAPILPASWTIDRPVEPWIVERYTAQLSGFPANRARSLQLPEPLATAMERSIVGAWAARGGWDTALTEVECYRSHCGSRTGAVRLSAGATGALVQLLAGALPAAALTLRLPRAGRFIVTGDRLFREARLGEPAVRPARR